MARSEKCYKAFTLVELLVVIGIIAILIAILMPALSRARKQALQVSCGSQVRQITYGSLAYANDFKQWLPTINGAYEKGWQFATDRRLNCYSRLPIIGFDSVTIWDYGTYFRANGDWSGPDCGLGGFAFTMRDYLKNDWDVFVCPDGWLTRDMDADARTGTILKRFAGCTTWSCGNHCVGCTLYQDGRGGGYLILIDRPTPETIPQCLLDGSGAALPARDRSLDVVRMAQDKPELLCYVDYNAVTNWNDVTGTYDNGIGCIMANHSNSPLRNRTMSDCNRVIPLLELARIGSANPDLVPTGLNTARLDARVTWTAFQDVAIPRYCARGGIAHMW